MWLSLGNLCVIKPNIKPTSTSNPEHVEFRSNLTARNRDYLLTVLMPVQLSDLKIGSLVIRYIFGSDSPEKSGLTVQIALFSYLIFYSLHVAC